MRNFMSCRLFTILTAASLLLAGAARGSMEESGIFTEPKPGQRPITAYRTEAKIIIDGKLDEPAWQEAHVIDGFYTRVAKAGSGARIIPAHSRTRVRVLWDDEYIYIGAEMDDKDIYAVLTEKNSRTWYDDVFEIFIKPAEDSSHYYEFQVTPKNTTLELFLGREGDYRTFESRIFCGGLQTAVTVRGEINNPKVEDEGWTAEIAIPFSAFRETVPPPETGTVWTAAFCRYDYSHYLPEHIERMHEGRRYETSSSAVLTKGSFHHYPDYDKLIFLEK